MRRGRGSAGITLVEMLTCITVLAVLSGVTAVAFDAILDHVRASNRQVQLLIDVRRAQRFIVNDVRRATALPTAYGAYDADSTTLICTVPAPKTADGEAAGSSVIIYAVGGRDGRSLVRRVFSDADDSTSHTETIILGDIDGVVFDRSLDASGRVVRFTVSAPKDLMHKDGPTVYSFVAGREYD
ncbi:MAG: hypothetical protein JW889_00225 [Verrucomicrobia bacterium]|nr:hypothetical protein [Verrucomicrobiota bacterium]